MGRGILAGHFDAFYWGQHYGGVEPYVVAAVLGPINGGPMGLNATPAVLAAVAAVLAYAVLRTGGPAVGWPPWARPWSGSGPTPRSGIRCARSAFAAPHCAAASCWCCAHCGYSSTVPVPPSAWSSAWPPASGGGPHPRSSTSLVPAVVLLVASWDRLYAPPPGAEPTLGRAVARRRRCALDRGGRRRRRSPLDLHEPAVGLRFAALRQPCATSVRLRDPRVDLLPPCAPLAAGSADDPGWRVGRREHASVTRSSWSSSSRWRSCWCVQRGWPGWAARPLRYWPPGWPWWPSPSSMRTSPRPGTGSTAATASTCRHSSCCSPSGRCPGVITVASTTATHARRRRHPGRLRSRPGQSRARGRHLLDRRAGPRVRRRPDPPPGLLLRMVRSERGRPSGRPLHGRPSHPHRLRRLLDRLRPRLPGPAHGDGQPVALGRPAFGQPGPERRATAPPKPGSSSPPGARPLAGAAFSNPEPGPGGYSEGAFTAYLTAHGDGYRVVHLGILDAVLPQHPVRHLRPLGLIASDGRLSPRTNRPPL